MNGRSVKVTQIAFPENVTAAVYRSRRLRVAGQNPTTNARDNVFSDGESEELISITGGDTSSGYSATFRVASRSATTAACCAAAAPVRRR